ncbi:hypothetical protein LCGC14_0378480 [marine sediment metagenome]|uniref:Uncharacterized protein n=1 Tax=marine sediment metagenome TaxID=412755 RepID=A0A0F9T2U8_9ZZZZ
MAKKNHALAHALVQGALNRYTAEPRQDHEGDAQLIVLGAILEEVGAKGWMDRLMGFLPLLTVLTAATAVWMILEKV